MAQEKRLAIASMLVPLYLVLLFFFIFMVSHSPMNKERSHQILQSVGQHFIAEPRQKIELADLARAASPLTPIQSWVHRTFPTLAAKDNIPSHHPYSWMVAMPLRYFFVGQKQGLTSDGRQFFKRLSELIKTPTNPSLKTHCWIGFSGYEHSAYQAGIAQARALALMQLFSEYELAPTLFTVGIQEQASDQLQCAFLIEQTPLTIADN